jgi:hypothetical protein
VTTARGWRVAAEGSLTGAPCPLPGGSSLRVMESWNRICTFLASRWAMITFEQASVGTFGEMRRVLASARSCTFPAHRLYGVQGRLVGVRHWAKIDTCSAGAMNDSEQLSSAVPELRSTW